MKTCMKMIYEGESRNVYANRLSHVYQRICQRSTNVAREPTHHAQHAHLTRPFNALDELFSVTLCHKIRDTNYKY